MLHLYIFMDHRLPLTLTSSDEAKRVHLVQEGGVRPTGMFACFQYGQSNCLFLIVRNVAALKGYK